MLIHNLHQVKYEKKFILIIVEIHYLSKLLQNIFHTKFLKVTYIIFRAMMIRNKAKC